MLHYDYHTHTVRSDGKATQLQMIAEAKRLGLKEFGISDHLCLHQPKWSMTLEEAYQAIDDLAQVKKEEKAIAIKVGLEIDYLPGKEKIVEEVTAHPGLDYVIGAVHYLGDWNFDTAGKHKKLITQEHYLQYYRLIAEAANSGLFDIIAHFDLIKKFNRLPANLSDSAPLKALDSIAKSGVAIELNTNGKNKPCKAFYPAEKWLHAARERNIPIQINSDAHNTRQIAQYGHEATRQLKTAGYKNTVGFTLRERYNLPLP